METSISVFFEFVPQGTPLKTSSEVELMETSASGSARNESRHPQNFFGS